MATFKIVVFKHQKRKDGKYPVSIRVTWKQTSSYVKTEFYVTEKQINKKEFVVKDTFILNELNSRIAKFEEIKSKKLGYKIELYTSKSLVEYFINEIRPGSDAKIDFIAFARLHIERLRSQGRNSYANLFQRTLNVLIDFCNGREKLPITEITYKFLTEFEAYLRTTRTMKRLNQFGKLYTIKRKGLSDVSIFNYLTDIRTLFNYAIKEYNDDEKDDIKISHYPFNKFKIIQPMQAVKRNLQPEQIVSILKLKDADLNNYKRPLLARDVFILSFYLVGMNTIDLFNLKAHEYKNGRFTYKRIKTKNRRKDHALISIKVEPEIIHLIEKYKDTSGKRVFDFYKRYTDSHVFNGNLNKGLKLVAEAAHIDEELSTYFARHSWASIARNKCGISKDDVNLALNHVELGLKMADVYIEKDWSLIDNANRTVIDYINKVYDESI